MTLHYRETEVSEAGRTARNEHYLSLPERRAEERYFLGETP